MAVESWTERATGRVTEAALRLRQPARRFAGSVRSAVTVGAIVIGRVFGRGLRRPFPSGYTQTHMVEMIPANSHPAWSVLGVFSRRPRRDCQIRQQSRDSNGS
ncbi:Protein of unknown function [Gryllus bimaculatus]|nr:Protein of unknown function [Gryllus bimaculatus]